MSIINRDKEKLLDHNELLSLIKYDPDTGIFTWKVARGPRAAGALAGNLQTNGYYQIRINKKLYLAHRLAWFYIFKEWPEGVVDHIDRNTTNNRLDNLRDVTQAKNTYNSTIPSHNSSGFKGVSFSKQKGKYEAYISLNNKKKNLGLFNTAEEAYAAYTKAVDMYRGS